MKALQILLLFSLGFTAEAQTKKQLFIGSGVTTAWTNGSQGVVTVTGFALVVPMTEKIFVRPVVAAGEAIPLTSAKSFPILQGGCLVGYRATGNFSLLSGFAEIMQFPSTGAVYLPTIPISTATRVDKHWGIFTPVTINARGYGVSVQLGYSW